MTYQEAKQATSPIVAEAQARLLAMRAELCLYPADRNHENAVILDGRSPNAPRRHNSPTALPSRETCRIIADLPEHLGWGNHRLSQTIRQSLRNEQLRNQKSPGHRKNRLEWLQSLLPPTPGTNATTSHLQGDSSPNCPVNSTQVVADVNLDTIKLHPDIGLGILRRKAAAAGRIWLLLRWLDNTGRGWITVEQVRKTLCSEDSASKICGWRQMRSLFSKGEGIFWEQRNGRLWLRSIPKVALALNIERLTGRPVTLPVKILLAGIGQVRAHLYASFHSGRKEANPISRTSLSKICQVSPRTQQDYERRAGVRKQRNYAVGPSLTQDVAKDRAWQQGSACFNWHDIEGAHGPRGRAYLAWQIPNSYIGPHKQRPHGRQKQFNRELAVLFTKGITGNDHFKIELQPRCYFDTAKSAAKGHAQTAAYWRENTGGRWYILETAGTP